ncbi:unspecific monooxygenase [Nocardia transvalensis]|uniref:Unspecific monooxygenase n=1 Tax=Nocardia transvalensis TaxID=37333 RepID=A0A7W9P8L6_9NOCA|nr:cytochrome P450 [Nocardia transvalensis]MBB5911365.1 unspecific monooxygenase [Nocardia transvalensis]
MTSTQVAPTDARPERMPRPPWRVPLLGDVLTTDFAKPCQRLARQARTLGPVFEQKLFGYPAVIVTGTRAVAEVNNEAVWEKHIGHSLMKLRPLAGDGLFTAFNREPNWATAHNILVPAFSKAAMTTYHSTITATVRELTDRWAAQSPSTWVDIPAATNALTFEIISRAGFSQSFDALSGADTNPFVAAMVRELTYANRRTDVMPWFERTFRRGDRRRHRQDLATARSVVDDLIGARRAQPHDEQRDMLDLMLGGVDPESGESLDDTNIRHQILTFLIAGSETSANIIAFALHYLAAHPRFAEEVRAELDQRWPTPEFPAIGFDDVGKLRALRRVVDETLRLWPTGPGYFRRARQDTTLCDGRYRFRQKDWVLVLLLAAHRDPAWGPDADEFNPDRFLPDTRRTLGPHIYKPFGTGPRACIGRQFAHHEITIALAAILHQFDLEPDPSYHLDVRETLTLKPSGLRLRLHPRKP